MFSIDTVVDQSVTAAKQFGSLIKDPALKSEYEKLVEAQAQFAKSTYKTSLSIAEQFVKNLDAYKLVK